jgi:hypothetical protein
MGNFITNPPASPMTPPVRRMLQIAQQYSKIESLGAQIIAEVWEDPTQAQAVLNTYGTNAATLVLAAQIFAQAQQSATGVAPAVVPTGYALTVNGDGTVTVTPPAS